MGTGCAGWIEAAEGAFVLTAQGSRGPRSGGVIRNPVSPCRRPIRCYMQ